MKIASITPIWNAELFIKPHFNMLSSLDKNVVFYNSTPWGDYGREHYTTVPDQSIDMIKSMFSNVQIIETKKIGYKELVPFALEILKDYAIITRLDVDMLLTKKDWNRIVHFMRNNDPITYFTDWSKHTINYYADWDHGLADAQEWDPLFLGTFSSEAESQIIWKDWKIHHFRGWNKPKSIKKGWEEEANIKKAHFQFGPWISCPQEIRDMFDPLLVKKWFDTFL